MPMKRPAVIALLIVGAIACGRGGDSEKVVPNPLAPGEVANITLCGSTTENRAPCADTTNNVIQFRAVGPGGTSCPCYSFSFANQSLNDLGSPSATYDFTGFRPGTYTLTGQVIKGAIDITFWHNTSTSTIGVVPSSIQTLSGPVRASNPECRIGYQPTGNQQLPASFSFQFTVAAASSGGSC
ncbi:MAG: hypothetical protein Q7R41_08765 [Phycisphaerales bacterium]|nr:hypothetical protein [Phycisphaerales bacterium]